VLVAIISFKIKQEAVSCKIMPQITQPIDILLLTR